MPMFFAHQRGTVVRLDSQRSGLTPMPFQIKIESSDGPGGIGSDASDARAIITQAGIALNGSFQFLHTLNETIYAYVFGDRMGELRVSGVAFSQVCGLELQGTGMKSVLDNYEAGKISARVAPVMVNFGDTPFRGFLTGMNLDVSDAENQLGQWAFRFHTFPGKSRG